MAHDEITISAVAVLKLDWQAVEGRWQQVGNRFRIARGNGEVDLGSICLPHHQTPHEMITEFLAVERGDIEALLHYLNATGVWDVEVTEPTIESLWEVQDKLRAIVTRKKWGYTPEVLLEEELGDESSLRVRLLSPERRHPGRIEISVSDTRTALFTAAWVEWTGGIRRAYCARRDCPDHRPGLVPFELTRPDKRYCSQYCAHLESLRQSRALARQHRGRRHGKAQA